MKNDFLDRLTRRVEHEDQQRTRALHKGAYHRYFEGYSEYTELDEKGQKHLRRVYTGEYYTHDMTRRARVLLKAGHGLLLLAACVLAAFGAVQTDAGNNRWYVAIWQVGDILCLAWAVSGVFNYWINPPRMTVGEWRSSSVRLQRADLAGALFLAATGAAVLVDYALCQENLQGHALCALRFLLSLGLLLTQRRIESGVLYQKTPSENRVPDGASLIS